MNGYICCFHHRTFEVYAPDLMAATQKAIQHFKPSESQEHLISVILAEKDGKSVIYSTSWTLKMEDTAGRWQPIETAPRDETIYFLATNGSGVWMAHWDPEAASGYRFNQPWRSVMLIHWNIKGIHEPPTHWMPLPLPPSE